VSNGVASNDPGSNTKSSSKVLSGLARSVPLARAAGDPRPPLDAEQIKRATYLVEACGGREWTAVRAKANLDTALGALERVRLSAIPHRDLADIAVYVVERES
jgi:geranylgeranyl pyrophosphate synthase